MNAVSRQPGKASVLPKLMAIGIVAVALVVILVIIMVVSSSSPATAAPATLSPEAQQGKTLFLSTGNCGSCHPSEGRAGSFSGPRLSTLNLSEASLRQVIRQGKGMMPGNSSLTNDDITKMIAYLLAIKAAAG